MGVRDREAVIAELRGRISAIRAGAPERPPGGAASDADEGRGVLPLPRGLESLLPWGGLPRGRVVGVADAGSLVLGIVAAVSAGGGQVAIVGGSRFCYAAALEMGAVPGRVVVVPEAGADPAGIVAVLLGGMDLVVVAPPVGEVPAARARGVAARVRGSGSVLLTVGGAWGEADLLLEAGVCGYAGLGRGCGRVRGIELEVSARGRGLPGRRVRWGCGCAGAGVNVGSVGDGAHREGVG